MAECMEVLQSSAKGEISIMHSYAKSQPIFKARSDREEKIPSFMHSYAKPQLTPVKIRSKRCRGSPTGETPNHPAKQIHKNAGSRWEEREIEFLTSYLRTNHPSDPIPISFWNELSRSMNQALKTSRTGLSCRSYYKRNCEANLVYASTYHENEDLQFQPLEPVSVTQRDSSCQTDISIPLPSKTDAYSTKSMHFDSNNEISTTIDMLKKHQTKQTVDENCRSLKHMAEKILDNQDLRNQIWKCFLLEIQESAKYMTQRRYSYLSDTTYEGLLAFRWSDVVREMEQFNPLLLEVLLAVSVNQKVEKDMAKLVPELGIIYGILMKRRFKDLSRIQRFVTMSLSEEKVHQKVYDRLQPLGVTVSHTVTLKVQKQIGNQYMKDLVDAAKDGKTFRIIGDNVNFLVKASHQRHESANHMEHWFASAAIVQHHKFSELSPITPQKNLLEVNPEDFLPLSDDWKVLRKEYAILVLGVVCRFLKMFSGFKSLVQPLTEELIPTHYDVQMKHTVIPLPVLPKNEQCYSDVVQILDSYEELINEVYTAAGKEIDENLKVHIGGDQLTRERFSGAKRLRKHAVVENERFTHLSPITFELFHLQITILSLFYKLLYKKDSVEFGTLHGEKVRLSRTDANGEDVKNHYDHCKELAVSLTDSYIVAAAMEHYGMETLGSTPTRNFDSSINDMSEDEKKTFILHSLEKFVDDYIIIGSQTLLMEDSVATKFVQIEVKKPNGESVNIQIPVLYATNPEKSKPVEDNVMNYALRVLEIGMAFKCLTNNVKIPNRDRLLPLMKYLMCMLKGHNNNSKYALEILRFLFHQKCTLDEQTAYQSFYGLFVNNKGKHDTSIPADLQMEHIVKMIKGHLKAVHSNKTENAMSKRTAAFAGMERISDAYDENTHVVTRSQKHKIVSSHADECLIIHDLESMRPFHLQRGRLLPSFPKPVQSPLVHLNSDKFKSWIRDHQYNLYQEIGN